MTTTAPPVVPVLALPSEKAAKSFGVPILRRDPEAWRPPSSDSDSEALASSPSSSSSSSVSVTAPRSPLASRTAVLLGESFRTALQDDSGDGSTSESSRSTYSPTSGLRRMASRRLFKPSHRDVAELLGQLQQSGDGRRGSACSDVDEGDDGDADKGWQCPTSPTSLAALFDSLATLFVESKISALDRELKIFFAVYPLFTTPSELLAFLTSGLRQGGDAAPFYRLAVTTWLEFDPRAAALGLQLQAELRLIGNLSPRTRIELEQALYVCCFAGDESAPRPCRLLPHFEPAMRSSITTAFWALQPRHAAQHLAASHASLLQNVRPWDLLEHNATHNNQRCRDVSVHFNNVVSWVASTILKCSTPRKRARRIGCWIKIAEAARQAGFLSVVLMLSTALDNYTVSRLKKTWAEVSQSARDALADILALCSPTNNFALLRRAAHAAAEPLPLALTLKDILVIFELLPGAKDDDIAYDRYHLLGRTLIKQTNAYAVGPARRSYISASSHLSDFLLNPVPRYSEEKLIARSQTLEPPKHAAAAAAAAAAAFNLADLSSSSSPSSPSVVVVENALRELVTARSLSSSSASSLTGTPASPSASSSSWSAHSPLPSPTFSSADSFSGRARATTGSELRKPNELFVLLKQQQQLQQNLLPPTPSPSSSSLASPSTSPLPSPSKRKRKSLSHILAKLASIEAPHCRNQSVV